MNRYAYAYDDPSTLRDPLGLTPCCDRLKLLPQHVAQLRRHLPALLEDDGNELKISTRCLFHSLYEELVELETKIAAADERIDQAFRANPECQHISFFEACGGQGHLRPLT